MRELSQHALDLIYNSIEAGARKVEVLVTEDGEADLLTVSVADDGRGMDEENARKAVDPFFTSRTTREVGLGLSLLEASARASGGDVQVQSRRGEGTIVTARFRLSDIDRQPLGDMVSTLLVVMVAAPQVRLGYRHEVDGQVFVFDTKDLQAEAGGLPMSHPAMVKWLRFFLEEGLRNLREAGYDQGELVGRPEEAQGAGAPGHPDT